MRGQKIECTQLRKLLQLAEAACGLSNHASQYHTVYHTAMI